VKTFCVIKNAHGYRNIPRIFLNQDEYYDFCHEEMNSDDGITGYLDYPDCETLSVIELLNWLITIDNPVNTINNSRLPDIIKSCLRGLL
jgi:hypothetical protein